MIILSFTLWNHKLYPAAEHTSISKFTCSKLTPAYANTVTIPVLDMLDGFSKVDYVQAKAYQRN